MKSLSKLALCLLLAMSLTVSAFAAQVPDSLVPALPEIPVSAGVCRLFRPLKNLLLKKPLYDRKGIVDQK